MPPSPTPSPARTLRAWTAALLVTTAVLFALGATLERHAHHAETAGETAAAAAQHQPGAEAGHTNEAAETGHNDETRQPSTSRTPATPPHSAQPTPTTRPSPKPPEQHGEQGEHHNETGEHHEPTTTRNATAIGTATPPPSSRTPTPTTTQPTADPASSEPAPHTETGHERGETRPFGLNLEAPALVAATVLASLLLAAILMWRPHRVVLAVTLGFALAAGILDLAETRYQATGGQATLAVLAASIALLHLAVAGLAATIIRRTSSTATRST